METSIYIVWDHQPSPRKANESKDAPLHRKNQVKIFSITCTLEEQCPPLTCTCGLKIILENINL